MGKSGAWVDEEFESLDLGDPLRDRWAKELLKQFAALPTASIPGACDDWSQTIAAYRFLGNEQIDWRGVMQPRERTAARARQFPVVLCIADTTELKFHGQVMEGLGLLTYESQWGMYLHPTYAVTPDREPLGVIDVWIWAREPKGANGHRSGIKESVRWIEGYERVASRAAAPDTGRVRGGSRG